MNDKLAIYLAAMADSNDEDQELPVLHLVDDSKAAHPKAPKARELPFEHASRVGLLAQAIDGPH